MKCGYCKIDLNAPLGCHLAGNLTKRVADKIADPLHVRAVAFQQDGLAIFLWFDLCGIAQGLAKEIRCYVAEQLGCDYTSIFVSATHTHTGPVLYTGNFPAAEGFRESLKYRAVEAARGAVVDLKEAKLFFAASELPGITFVRRFRMKDGTVRTNPGRHNPNILEPMSQPDETIRLLKITRETGDDITIVNFQVHPDVYRGTTISADYPAVVCNTLEQALPGTKCVYFNGTAGNLNHIDVNCPEWDANNGPEHVLHMGRSIAGKILSIYTKARPVADGPVRTSEKEVVLALKIPDPAKIPEAEQYVQWYKSGEHDKIPHKGMEFITAVYEAQKTLTLAKAGGKKSVWVSAASIGEVAFAGIPGEGFCEIGQQIRSNSPFAAQFTLGLTNGSEGYFPMKDAFEVNGYESRTSSFQPGVGEALAAASDALIGELYNIDHKE